MSSTIMSPLIVQSKHECAVTCKIVCCASTHKPAAAINQVGRDSMERSDGKND